MSPKAYVIAAFAASLAIPCDALHLVKRDVPNVVPMQIHRSTEPKIFHSRSALTRRAKTVSQTLDNFEDGSLYFANVTIGTPPQSLRFHIDTGSSDLWANVANSQLCEQSTSQSNDPTDQGQDIPCSVSGTYSANDSSTYKFISNKFGVQYGDGSAATGDYVSDTVRIGGVSVANQQFGVGYQSNSSTGVMGIGYAKLEAQYQNPTGSGPGTTYANLPQSMVDQGFTNSNAYSLWLDDIYSSTGNILFGGVDTDKYQGSLRTLDIVQEGGGYYEMLVSLNSITFNSGSQNSTVLSSTITVLLDSGTTISYLPSSVASSVFSAVGARYSSTYGAAFCPCELANSTDTLSFNFGGKVITVAMQELVIPGGISQQYDCVFGIAPLSSVPAASQGQVPYILGDSFIRNAYIVYDLSNNQISLAQTNTQSTSSNIMEIGTGTDGVPDVTGSAAPAATSLATASNNVQGIASSTSSSRALAAATSVPLAWAVDAAVFGAAVAAAIL